jgi:carbon starvation protein
LLATIALAIGTVYLVNNGKLRYAWTTAIPMVFVGVTTFTAAVLSIATIFWPLTHAPETRVQGYLDSTLMAMFLVGVVAVVAAALRRIWATLHGVPLPQESFAATSVGGTDKLGCC